MRKKKSLITLYHYSSLFHLPPIIRQGLRRGEIASPDVSRTRVAVSLTAQRDADECCFWGRGSYYPEKTAIRYVCTMDKTDSKLEGALAAWARLKVSPRFLRSLDPQEQAKWWYFYHGIIPREKFVVEFRGKGGYVSVSPEQLNQITRQVSIERDKFELIVPPGMPWALNSRLKDPSDPSPNWILNVTHPADLMMQVSSQEPSTTTTPGA